MPSAYFLNRNTDGEDPTYRITGRVRGTSTPGAGITDTGAIELNIGAFVDRYAPQGMDVTAADIEPQTPSSDTRYLLFHDSGARIVNEGGAHYGILMVNGDLRLDDTFHGLIIANGDVHVSLTGAVNGAVISGGAVTVDGTVNFNSCEIAKALGTLDPITFRTQ